MIYIEDFYTGEETYIDGSYREDRDSTFNSTKIDFERNLDAERRFKSNLKYVTGKRVADFGCGSGDFLKMVKPTATASLE